MGYNRYRAVYHRLAKCGSSASRQGGGSFMPHKDKEKRKSYHRAYGLIHRRSYRRPPSNETQRRQRNASNQNLYWSLKAEALRVLGNKCACPGCEVSESAFLTIDHIHGRPKGSHDKSSLLHAKRSGWDKTLFQILCYNCNCAKRDRGFCPVHQSAPKGRKGHNPAANSQQALWSFEGE